MARIRTMLPAAALLLSGCVDNPLWARDDYRLEGRLTGDSCEATLDGDPTPFAARSRTVMLSKDGMFNVGLAPGVGAHTIACGGLILLFTGPTDLMPAAGRYHVSRIMLPAGDSVGVLLDVPRPVGWWPLAWNGATLKGRDGYLQIDSLVHTGGMVGRAHGRFAIRMQRSAGG